MFLKGVRFVPYHCRELKHESRTTEEIHTEGTEKFFHYYSTERDFLNGFLFYQFIISHIPINQIY